MSNEKHTPTPWKATKQLGNHLIHTGTFGASDQHNIAATFCEEESEANAALIVRAVNNHEALVFLLSKAYAYVHDNMGAKSQKLAAEIKSALKQATE